MLPAIGLAATTAILEQERDFHDPCPARGHKRVPKNSMHHGTQRQLLRMSTHSPPRHQDDQSRQNIPLRPSVPAPGKPHTEQTCAPPYNPHTRVLQIIPHPRMTPTMLGERVHTTPSGDDAAVEELLTAAGFPKPGLSNQQHQRHNDPVAMNAEPMMKCARHWPRWSPRQYPMATIPPKSICVHATMGMVFPSQP